MEVHQHSHHGKKKWTEYFWEFFMLFLAVTLGFFMENQREKFVEQKRTKVLAGSLYDDIKKDTASLHAVLTFSNAKMDSIDAMIRMLHLPNEKWNDTLLYTHAMIASRVAPFEWTAGTYEQIIASGSLRYFDQSVVTLLNAYAVQAKKILAREDIDLKVILEQYFPFLMRFLNNEVTTTMRFGEPITGELYYTKTDLATIRELINIVMIMKATRQRTMQEYQNLLAQAQSVLTTLKKEYNLK